MTKPKLLVLCTGNSARSQMAEGLIRAELGEQFEVYSAGTNPSGLRKEAVAVMSEIGIDISHHRSKSVDEFVQNEVDFVLTVCDHASETCPVFPAKTRVIHRSFEDPAGVVGSEERRLEAFGKVRDEIARFTKHELLQILKGDSR